MHSAYYFLLGFEPCPLPSISPTTYQMTCMFLTKLRPFKNSCAFVCAVPSAWHGLPISTCLTPSCSSGLHLNITSSDKHSLNCPRHGSPPSSSGLPQGPVHTSITPFDMWYYNFLFTCQVHWTVTLWKHGLSVCLLWFYFCFSAPCQVYTECGLNEQLHLEGVNIFTYIMDIGILLLPQLPHPYTETHTFSLHSGVCRLWVASSMVFTVVVEAQGRDLAEVTTRRMYFMLSPIVLVSRMCLTLDLF